MKVPSNFFMAAALPLAPLLVALALPPGAAAQTVYRCGEGGRTYQNSPCTDGRPVDVADPRTDEQRRAAKESTAADARLAGKLERERRASEAELARRNAVTVVAPPVPSLASAPYARHVRRPLQARTRYFADGTPVPPVYRVPVVPKGDSKGR